MDYLVTVVVALHNSSKDLLCCIGFLRRQTFRNFFVLFVDDCSADDTLLVLKNALEKEALPFDLLRKSKNDGAGKTRDYALESGLIRTKYVLFLDPDDEPLPDFLESLVEKAEETNADITMCGYERRLRSDGHLIATEMVNNPNSISDLENCRIIPYLNPATWNKLFKTSIIEDARFINRGGGEDEMFFLKVLPRCNVIAFVNRVLYRYFIHGNSVSSFTNCELLLLTRNGYVEVKKYYESHGDAYAKFYDLLEASIFVRFGIGATTRLCLTYPKKIRVTLKENKLFFRKFFPNWFCNPFLSFKTSFFGGIKALMVWRCKWLFKLGLFRIFIFDYKLFTRVFKKDVKW